MVWPYRRFVNAARVESWRGNLWVSNLQLRCEWELDESVALRLPAVMLQVGWVDFGFAADLGQRIAFKECGRNKLTSWRRMIVRLQGATTGA